jgi:hypothetical protein
VSAEAPREVRRALDKAKGTAGLDGLAERLSMYALRHSFASMLATDLEVAPTTLAQLIGHADAGFTLRLYACDNRDSDAIVKDVLTRAANANIGADIGQRSAGRSHLDLVDLIDDDSPRQTSLSTKEKGEAICGNSLRLGLCVLPPR